MLQRPLRPELPRLGKRTVTFSEDATVKANATAAARAGGPSTPATSQPVLSTPAPSGPSSAAASQLPAAPAKPIVPFSGTISERLPPAPPSEMDITMREVSRVAGARQQMRAAREPADEIASGASARAPSDDAEEAKPVSRFKANRARLGRG